MTYEGDAMGGQFFIGFPVWLWDLGGSRNDNPVFLSLRKMASNSFVCWPSIKTIAEDVGDDITYKQVRTSLDHLECALHEDGRQAVYRVPWMADIGDQTSNCYIVFPATPNDFSMDELRELRGGRPRIPVAVEEVLDPDPPPPWDIPVPCPVLVQVDPPVDGQVTRLSMIRSPRREGHTKTPLRT